MHRIGVKHFSPLYRTEMDLGSEWSSPLSLRVLTRLPGAHTSLTVRKGSHHTLLLPAHHCTRDSALQQCLPSEMVGAYQIQPSSQPTGGSLLF